MRVERRSCRECHEPVFRHSRWRCGWCSTWLPDWTHADIRMTKVIAVVVALVAAVVTIVVGLPSTVTLGEHW